MTRQPKRIAVAIFAFTCIAGPAAADEATETFLRDWVASIDASPDWNAKFDTLASNTTATTMTGLAVTSEKPGFTLTLSNLAVSGFTPSPDGTFVASGVRLDGGEITTGEFMTLGVASADFTDVSFPSAGGFVWDESKPFVSLIKAFSPITQVKLRTGRIGSVAITERTDNMGSNIQYEQINIDNWANGVIEAISAGPIHSESPAKEPLTAITIASAQTRDLNLNAFFEVFDPDKYSLSGGDMQWRSLIGKTTYRDMIAAMPGVSFTMSEAILENVRLRQPRGGIGILAELGPDSEKEFEDNPKKGMELLQLFSAYGFGKFEMRDLDLQAPGVDRMRLAGFSMTDFSSDLLGEIAFDRAEVAIKDTAEVNVRRFAFGGIVPPSLDAFMAAVEAQTNDEDVDFSSVIPHLGFLETTGVDVNVADMPRTTLESFRVDLRDYIGPVPTTISWDIVDADVSADLIEDDDVRQMLAKLGYDRVVLSTSLDAKWSEAGNIDIEQFRVAMKDVGAIYGDIRLAGIKPSDIPTIRDETALDKLSFVRGAVSFKDDSIVGRGLTMQAENLGVDPEQFREQFATGLPFMLAFLGDPKLQGDVMPILQQFIRTAGGTISVLASPAAPVPFAQFEEAMESAPLALLKTLNISFSGLPGVTNPPQPAATEEAAPANDDEAAPEAAPSDGTQFEEAPADGGDTFQQDPPKDTSTPSDSKPAKN